MKKIIGLFAICVLTLASCSTEETVVSDIPQLSQSDYANMWQGFNKRLGDTSLLFYYSTPTEAATLLTSKVVGMESDLRGAIDTVAGAKQLTVRIRVGDGKAVLTDYHFFDDKGDFISSYELDNNSQYQTTSSIPFQFLLAAFGSCPQGYTSLGFCFYNNAHPEEFANCMGSTQQQFTASALEDEGDYMYLYVSVAATGMQLCGQSGPN